MLRLSVRSRVDRGFSMIELLIVVGIGMIVSAIAVPMMSNSIGNFRLSGDVRSLTNAISLAKLRAAAEFSKARIYVDTSSEGFHIETWTKGSPGSWGTEGGITYLSSTASESYSFSPVLTPPANTQGTLAQAPQCLTATGTAVGNSACIVFNSRGIPVTDAAGTTGSPTNAGAFYLTDTTTVYGITVSATGVIQVWRTKPTATPVWALQ